MSWPERGFLVVGAGVAGALTVHRLRMAGRHVTWVDDHAPHSSTSASAGILNPVTGRKFVYSWRFDECLEEALSLYRELGSPEVPLVQRMAIGKVLSTPGELNNWCLRLANAPYDAVMHEPVPSSAFPFLIGASAVGRIDPVWRVDLPAVIRAVQDRWGLPLEGRWTGTSGLELAGRTGIPSSPVQVILATGAPNGPSDVPSLPLAPFQGQALLIRTQDLPGDMIFHHKVKVVPLGQERFWVGSWDRWEDRTAHPVAEGRQALAEMIDRHFDIRYEILGDLSGIRPASRTRRPFAGKLAGQNGPWIINGLGTKGASLAPLVSRHLCEALLTGIPVPADFRIPD